MITTSRVAHRYSPGYPLPASVPDIPSHLLTSLPRLTHGRCLRNVAAAWYSLIGCCLVYRRSYSQTAVQVWCGVVYLAYYR